MNLVSKRFLFFFFPISEDVCFYNLMAACDLVLRSLSLQVWCKENCFVSRMHLIAGMLKLMHDCTYTFFSFLGSVHKKTCSIKKPCVLIMEFYMR